MFVDPGGKKAECLFNGIASGEVVEEEVEEEVVETADGKAGSPKLRHPQKSERASLLELARADPLDSAQEILRGNNHLRISLRK